jgi:hypothetical protein
MMLSSSPGIFEVALKMDYSSKSLARSGSSISPRLSTNSSRLPGRVAGGASGFVLSTRCRWKSSAPSATQTYESKTKVVPFSSTTLVKLNDAIEFAGFLMNSST